MSISEREQQALDSIEYDLASSGPELASKLDMFAWLSAGEEMPKREKIWRSVYPFPAGAPAAGASTGTGASADTGASKHGERTGAYRIKRRLSRQTAWQLLWLVAAVTLFAFLLTVDRGTGKGVCTASRTAACRQTPAPAHSKAVAIGGL